MANSIKIGGFSFDALKIGGSDVDAAYLGDTLVYSGGTPTLNNIIEYTASSKLSETTTSSSAGLHTYAFSGTSGQLTITSHTFDNGVGTIVFDDDVKRVGTYAFYGCSEATSITIPSSVSAFDNQPFWGCTSLTDITIKATTAPTFDRLVFDNTNNCNINVPCDSLVDYASDSMFFKYSWLSRLKGISPCTNKVRYSASGTTCHDYDLYQVYSLQLSTDNGSTWSYVSPVVTQESLLEENSQSCGYVPTHDYSLDYFTIVSLSDNNAISYQNSAYTTSVTISYSTDNGDTWTDATASQNTTVSLATLNTNDRMLVKGTNDTLGGGYNKFTRFNATGDFNVEGNTMSLLYGDNFSGQTTFVSGNSTWFPMLFSFNTHILNAENLVLPATDLHSPKPNGTSGAYNGMFRGCSNLLTAPQLPATKLNQQCYASMFEGCTSLTTAPELPATFLASNCYSKMFCMNRTNPTQAAMTVAPELPATTLASKCYENMFLNNASLTTAPSSIGDSSRTMVTSACTSMFQGCTSLTTAPQLPATTLASYCYDSMFRGCTSLNSITCLATDISATDCTYDWVRGVAANGTFTKNASMSSWTTDDSGIPSHWTVVDYSS